MHQKDLLDYIERYEGRLRQFGAAPEALGWGKQGRQEVRFGVLAQPILENPSISVLDVGCGFADLYDYLADRGWKGDYCGLDIVPGLLRIARERHPNLDLREVDITADGVRLNQADCVVGSGLFNARLKAGDNLEHIECAIRRMHSLARLAVSVDFMSTYVEFQHPDGWHTDPAWAFAIGKRLSGRLLLRHDYMPFEFALIIYLDDSISPRNVFQATEEAIDLGKLP